LSCLEVARHWELDFLSYDALALRPNSPAVNLAGTLSTSRFERFHTPVPSLIMESAFYRECVSQLMLHKADSGLVVPTIRRAKSRVGKKLIPIPLDPKVH
jgi:hypothetical protein